MLKSTLTVFFVCILFSATAFSQRDAAEPLRVEQLAPDHWRVTVANMEPRLLTMPGEPPFGKVLIPGYETRIVAGLPALPLRALEFDLPEDGTLTLTISGLREEKVTADLAPFGGITTEEKRTTFAEILPATVREGRRIGGLRIQPARYDARTRTLTWLRGGVIDIRVAAAPSGNRSLAHRSGANAPGSASEAGAPAALAAPAAKAGDALLRIGTMKEGICRITYDDFLAAGFNPTGVDPALFRLTLMGEEIPLELSGTSDGSFDAGDAMLFFAPRKAGENGEYLDVWTDEQVFLLGWNGAPGLRWHAKDVAPTSHPSAVTMDAFPMRVHLEEDHEYHRGDFELNDMLITKQVEGETWIWGYLLKRDGTQKKDSIRARFDASSPAARKGLLRIRARGASRDTSLLRAAINGVTIGEQRIGTYQTVTAEWTIPAGLLLPAGNELLITNVGLVVCPPENPACSIERFYVDWAELQYATAFASASTPLHIDASARYAGNTPPADFLFSIPDAGGAVKGYDIAMGSRFENIDRSGGAARMALDSSGRYFLYSENDIFSPASVSRITIPEYISGTTQADYLLVTHRDFLAQAQRLADYRRQHDGYSTLIADVDDIYNAYNFGRKSPAAIRAFVKDAWERWPAPRPRFLLLLGDASWDARQKKESSTKVDYVPAYGNPVSDNYYVNFAEQSLDASPSLAVGRIPAETGAQADAVIDKIIAYESAPSQPWDDRILFSVGGENSFEQDFQLWPIVDALIYNWVEPYCLESHVIIKKTLDFVSYDDLDTLIHEVNEGVSWFFFVGHGGTRVIDVGVERPDIFDNVDKYIFFVTMSCNTAHFAEPFETGLNERFVMSPRNGAIAALGTSGLGLIDVDYRLSRAMFRAMVDSGVRNYGEMVAFGKRELVRSYGIGDQNSINTVNQVTLLGDPATHIPLANGPELAVRSGDLRTEPEILVEQTNAVIRTRLHNDGLCMGDTVDVLLTVTSGGEEMYREARRLPPFPVDTLLEWSYDFAGVDGSADIRVTLDPTNTMAEKDESNNSTTLTVNVLPRGLTQIFPLDRAVVGSGSGTMDFLLANPTFVPDAALDPRAEIEYSRDASFNSGVTGASAELGTVFTQLSAAVPSSDGTWYWRARLRTSGGPERWSPIRSFTLQPQSVTDERWLQSDAPQFSMTVTEALEAAPTGGVQLGERALVLEAVSGGFNGPFKNGVLLHDGVNVSTDRRGFNLAVVEPVYGRLVDTVNFDTYNGRDIAAQMAAYINAVSDDHMLMVAVRDDANGYPPSSIDGTNISPELRGALHTYGATLIDSVGFRDSYVLIGRRSDPARTREAHYVLGTAARRDTLIVRASEGRLISPVIGPANRVSHIRWEGTAGSAGSRVDLRIFALRGGAPDTLLGEYPAAASGTDLSLASLNPLPSAFLRIEAVLRDPQGLGKPRLDMLSLDYESRFPELGITSQVVVSDPDSVLEGESVIVRATVYNGGRAEAANLRMGLTVPGSSVQLEQPLTAVPRRLDEGVEVTFTVPTAGLRGEHSYELSIDGENAGSEYYRANNVFSKRFAAGRDGTPPMLAVTFDGVEIANNDFVAPRPVIEISLRDQSPLPVTDTSSVQLFLDGRRVWLMSDTRVSYTPGSGEEKIKIEFTPELSDGLHFLAVSGKDATGNAADTIPYQVRFNVSRNAHVDQLIPYPSPTTGPVDFTFRVIGSDAPDHGRVKIYTVAGRLIREIESAAGELRIGFNRIAWDGRDADGDALANGVYFYKLMLSVGGENSEQVGRFAVVR
ncbi:MAG: hypothetical protein IH600_15240 [Bacteroidetes bacterium]|nr:hypothetical protein [Bacteroidota bacterium]